MQIIPPQAEIFDGKKNGYSKNGHTATVLPIELNLTDETTIKLVTNHLRKIIGLSKLNRIVQYCAKKPQVQERLTEEIASALKQALNTQDVAVIIDATHLCVSMRGVNDVNSTTITSHFGGKFQNEDLKTEF